MPSVRSSLVEIFVYHKDDVENKYLLLKRSDKVFYPGLWSVCAGSIESGENTCDAAIRELKEETGIIPHQLFIVDHVNVFYENVHDDIHLVPVFLAESKDNRVVLNYEHADYSWMNAANAIERLHWVSHKKNIELIEECLNNKNYYKSLKKIL